LFIETYCTVFYGSKANRIIHKNRFSSRNRVVFTIFQHKKRNLYWANQCPICEHGPDGMWQFVDKCTQCTQNSETNNFAGVVC